MHHAWNGDIVNTRNQAKKNPENYQFETCKEGIPVGSDCMAIPSNAKAPGTATLFIDWILDPEHASQNIAWFGYPMPIEGSEAAFAKLAKRPGDRGLDRRPRQRKSVQGALARGTQGLGPRVDGGQGVTGAFWRRFLVPGALWLILFFAVPLGITIAISLGTPTELGGVLYGFNPGNYTDALDPLFAPVLLRSVGYAAATAAICLLVGYPVAYCIARYGGATRTR